MTAYSKTAWQDAPSTATPVDAANLNHAETQYDAVMSEATSAATAGKLALRDASGRLQVADPAAAADAATKAYVDAHSGSAAPPDATSTVKGVLQLAGDLAGTAAAPTVPGLAGKAPLANVVTAITATAWSPTLADNKSVLTFANAAAITATLPSDATLAAAVGFEFTAVNVGTGPVTLVAGSGAAVQGAVLAIPQYGSFRVIKSAANSWVATAITRDATGAGKGLVQLAGDLAGTAAAPTVPNMVNKTMIDAKGDLIVGTADNTAGRLAVGSAGQVLTSDPAQPAGMKWAAPTGGGGGGGVPPAPFDSVPTWRAPYPQQNANIAPTLGTLILAPVRIDSPRTLAGLGCRVAGAGTTGTVVVAVYDDTGAFFPGNLVAQSAAFSHTVTGTVSNEFGAVALAAGWYWFGILATGTGAPKFEQAVSSNSSPLDVWRSMPNGTGSAPSANAGNDGAVASQANLTDPPAVFAGKTEGAHNSGMLRYWIVGKFS